MKIFCGVKPIRTKELFGPNPRQSAFGKYGAGLLAGALVLSSFAIFVFSAAAQGPNNCSTGINALNHYCQTSSLGCAAGDQVDSSLSCGNFSQICCKVSGPPPPSSGPAPSGGIDSSLFRSLGTFFGGSGASPAGAKDLGTLIIAVVQILLVVAASLATIFLIVGGFRYVTASGNEEQTEAAKKTMSGAIIGLVVIVLSFAIVRIISAVLLGGAGGTGI